MIDLSCGITLFITGMIIGVAISLVVICLGDK
jgi:hypothetical protein